MWAGRRLLYVGIDKVPLRCYREKAAIVEFVACREHHPRDRAMHFRPEEAWRDLCTGRGGRCREHCERSNTYRRRVEILLISPWNGGTGRGHCAYERLADRFRPATARSFLRIVRVVALSLFDGP